MDRHVADAGFRILDDAHARGDVAAGVALRGPDRRNFHEIHRVAHFDDLLHRRGIGEDRRNGLREAARECLDHFGFGDAQREGPHRAVHHQLAGDFPAGEPDQVREVAGLALVDVGPVRDRRDVVVDIGRHVDALEQPRVCQRVEVAAQRLRRIDRGQRGIHARLWAITRRSSARSPRHARPQACCRDARKVAARVRRQSAAGRWPRRSRAGRAAGRSRSS